MSAKHHLEVRKKIKIKMEQDGGRKIRSSKTILRSGAKRRFGTMVRSSYPSRSAERLDKESKVSKKQCRHPNKGSCNDRWRIEMKRWREKQQRLVTFCRREYD